MSSGKLKDFTVAKRYELWAQIQIKAIDMNDAVNMAQKLDFEDFVNVPDGTEVLDVTLLSGTQVSEPF